MIRLYVEGDLCQDYEVTLSENQSHYLQRVMRLKEGHSVCVFNAQDGEWNAQILAHEKRATKLLLLSQKRSPREEGGLWLLFSPLKPKRQSFLVEKATELGVSSLKPICFERTSIPHVNLEKMRSQAIEAAEQCERLSVPDISPLKDFSKFLEEWPQDRTLVFGDEKLSSPSLSHMKVMRDKKYAFLIGPEGGLSSQELHNLNALPQGQGVTLNSNILRSETAALVGVSYLQLIMMDKNS